MELELRQDYISCWDAVHHTVVNQEETAEMIVPDACPDILQILDGEGKIFLQRKEAAEGRGEFSGLIKVCVLYRPERGGGMRSMEAVLPFACSAESPAITRRSQLMAFPRIQTVDVHVLNPRKILVKVNFIISLTCYTPKSIELCTSVEKGDQYSILQKTAEYRSHVAAAATEKIFHYSDTLALPAGRPPCAELLRSRAECSCNEAKVIGNKLVFKGDAKVSLLYRGEDDALHTTDFNLPFSQITDCGEAGEDAIPEVRVIYTDMSCKQTGEDGRNFTVELELLAQAVLRKTETRTVLSDLYSTSYQAIPVRRAYPVQRKMDRGVAPETVREVLETREPVETVLDVQIRPGQLTAEKGSGVLTLAAEVEVCILYLSEDGEIGGLHRRLIVPHEVPAANHWMYQCEFWVSREGTATPVGSGVEVSFTLEYSWTAMETSDLLAVEGVTLENRTRDASKPASSVTIRAVRPGESLWELAKAYGTTEAEIAEANALASTEIYPGQLLLIPRAAESITAEAV